MKVIGSAYEHNIILQFLDLVVYNIEELERVLQMYPEEEKIVCWMMTNNITGTCFPVEDIGKLCRKYNAYYIMDAVATIGHYPIPENLESFCDCLVTSGHKYHTEKGLGFMWVSDRFAKFLGLSDNSHEEFSLIHGTPNVGGAIALSHAVRMGVKYVESKQKQWNNLVSLLLSKLREHNINAYLASTDYPRTYAINALCLEGFNADSLVQFLSSRDIYVSPCYSACSENADYHTAIALGMTKEQAEQTIRVSFSEDSCEHDIDALVDAIVKFKKLFM